MLRNRRKIILILICIVILFFVCYRIMSKNSNNITVTETVIANVKSEKVSMPYINPEWEEYMKLSDEEKENVDKVPEIYIYNYVPIEDIYDDYDELPSRYNSVDEYPTTLYDQGNEGLCWAYATATMIESNLKRTRNIDEQISVKQLDYITADVDYYSNKYNPYSLNRKIGKGLKNSDDPIYMNGILMSGVIPVKKEKFNVIDDSNFDIYDVANTDNLDYTITETVSFPKYENTEEYRNMLKSYIKQYGGVWVGGTILGTEGHAVVITGWNDEGEIGFSGDIVYPEGTWIVQNSWNESEYDEYFIPYNTEDIQSLIGVKKIDDKNWDNLYNFSSYPVIEYKGLEIYQSKNGEKSESLTSGVANETYIRLRDNTAISGDLYVTYNKPNFKSEKLNMISFNSVSQNSIYKITISTDGDKSGFAYEKNIKTDLPGIYTIYFDDVILENEKFTIKIEADDGAVYTNVTAYTSDVDYSEGDIAKTVSYVDFGGKAYNGNYKYHIISYVNEIENGQYLSYKLYDENKVEIENIKINNSIIDNKKSVGVVEFSKSTKLFEKRYIDVIYNDNVINTVEIIYNPNVYMAGMKGNGTEENPYVITNSEQLSCISNSPSAYYILNNDIDLTLNSENRETYNKTKGWIPLEVFTGVLDGKGYSIKNLTINNDDPVKAYNRKNVGLFEQLDGAEIKNLKIENAKIINKVYFDNKYGTGILAGESINSKISNIMVTGEIISSSKTGLLVGKMKLNKDCNSLDNSVVIGNVLWENFSTENNGDETVGSIAGEITGRNIKMSDCIIISNLDCKFLDDGIIGGVCGTGSVEIKNSYVFAKMPEPENMYELFGKIVGRGYVDLVENVRTYKGYIYYDDIKNMGHIYTSNNAEQKNIELYESIENFKNSKIEDLKFSDTVWEYLGENVYPTLNSFPIYFINNIDVLEKINLDVEGEYKLNVNIKPVNATYKKIQYSSSDESIVTVDNNGKVKAKKEGTAIITISTCDGSNIIKEVKVTVGELITPYKINTYDSNEENKTISNIFPTTIEHYKENIDIQNPYVIKVFKDNKEVIEGNIATGMITKIYLNEELIAEYTNIVPGDVYTDGIVSSKDAGMVVQYLVGMLDNLYETPQYYAMDFTRDGKVRLNDVELIKQYVVKLYEPSEEDYYGKNN